MPVPINAALPLTALRSFEALVRYGNTDLASRELNVTTSAILHQIRVLEDHCGRKLVIRDKAQVTVTNAGARLFETCSISFEALRDVLADVTDSREDALNILLLRGASHHAITRVINAFIAKNPDIHVNVTAKATVAEETLDSYKIIVTTEQLTSELFRSVTFLTEKLIPVGRPDYVSKIQDRMHRNPVRILTVQDKNEEFQQLTESLSAIGYQDWNFIPFNNRRDAVKAATEGIGITMADPEFFAEEIYDNLLCHFSDCELVVDKTYKVMIKERALNEPVVRKLVELMGVKLAL